MESLPKDRDGYCMSCKAAVKLSQVHLKGTWRDGSPRYTGICTQCKKPCSVQFVAKKKNLPRLTAAMLNAMGLHKQVLQNTESFSRAQGACPRCGGYMRPIHGEGIEVQSSCINCGYAGPVILTPDDYMIRDVG